MQYKIDQKCTRQCRDPTTKILRKGSVFKKMTMDGCEQCLRKSCFFKDLRAVLVEFGRLFHQCKTTQGCIFQNNCKPKQIRRERRKKKTAPMVSTISQCFWELHPRTFMTTVSSCKKNVFCQVHIFCHHQNQN